jgi:two-component system, NtrC family, response regulator GlrR
MGSPHHRDTATDVQPHLALSLVAERARPQVTWSDAAGAHSADLEGRVLVGSSPAATVCVADRAVSRVHAELEVLPDGVWVRDLGSRNGTWVGGVLVRHARVPPDGRVLLGGTTLQLASGAAMRVPLWPHDRFGPLVARSEAMRALFVRLAQFASSDAPVLVQGETGTGKELVAEAIHEASGRAAQPFVVVDCASLPEALLEAELFGHARGAFTGAVTSRAGAFEAATGGTVFLDEIGELPMSMQPKLLRVLESQTVRRLGETEHRKVDVRFVSATHRDVQGMVAAGTFREDLFFRLCVLPALVPPLRARPDDVPLLLQHFLAKSPEITVSAELARELVAHPWPGNVRELRSFAERARTLSPAVAWAMTRGEGAPSVARPATSTPSAAADGVDLPAVGLDVPFKVLRERWVDHLEREFMKAAIEKHGRNVGAIADLADLDRSYVHRLLRKHGL